MTNRQPRLAPPPALPIEYAIKRSFKGDDLEPVSGVPLKLRFDTRPYLALDSEDSFDGWTDHLMGAWGTEDFAAACAQASYLLASNLLPVGSTLTIFSIEGSAIDDVRGLVEGRAVLVLP